jgi:hypothetical protein
VMIGFFWKRKFKPNEWHRLFCFHIYSLGIPWSIVRNNMSEWVLEISNLNFTCFLKLLDVTISLSKSSWKLEKCTLIRNGQFHAFTVAQKQTRTGQKRTIIKKPLLK